MVQGKNALDDLKEVCHSNLSHCLSFNQGRAYAALDELGATPLKAVKTAGGGAQNVVWQRIRERVLGVPVSASTQTEAAYGAALLAFYGCKGLIRTSQKSYSTAS